MSALTSIERFLERLFERPSTRLFHARLQPIQLQRRIERAMETARRLDAGRAAERTPERAPERTIVPHRVRVRLHPEDLAPFLPVADALAAELADAALAFARAHHYELLDRPRVALVSDARVEPGEIEVEAAYADPGPGPAGEGAPGAPGAPSMPGGPSADAAADGAARIPGTPAGAPVSPDTLVFSAPRIVAPAAVLHEVSPGGRGRRVALDGSLLTIGRAPDNRLVLGDRRVSRHHARIQARHGSLVLSDLGSTNGTRVNGTRIEELVLGEGDRIEVGSTVFVVERPGRASAGDSPAGRAGPGDSPAGGAAPGGVPAAPSR